jgi:hypothetical protein
MIIGMKKRITVTIEEGTYKALQLQNKNVSGYINDMLVERVIGTHKEQMTRKITNDVIGQLLKDETFFDELTRRVSAWMQKQY